MRENNTADWSIGCYVVQHQLNRRASEPRNNAIPYETYFGISTGSEVEKTLGELARSIRTEVGLQLIEGVLLQLKKTHPLLHLSDDKILQIIEQGDALYDAEDNLTTLEEKEAFDLDGKVSDLLKSIVSEVTDDSNEVPSCNEGGTIAEAIADDTDEDDTEPANYEEASTKQARDEKANEDSDSGRTEDEGEKQVQLKETLRIQAMEGQQQQARRVNAARGKEFKEVLDIGDICLIRTDATIRAATDKVAICVKICTVRPYTSPTSQVTYYKYKVCTSDGYLKSYLPRTMLEYQSKLTAEIMGIDETKEGFLSELTVEEASSRSNVLGGSTVCRCSTDCSKSTTCGCRKRGNFCNTKCHYGRGKNLYCQLCYVEPESTL